ncbi:MAG: 6-carboxytetrahydropterin synthase [Pirellulaceae bacterium]|nr:6-carboxytetrahydropterin synthase [Pirellulaceae bacterium]
MTKHFEVSVEKESLIFSAAHFITFGQDPVICEAIHGHNYRVACEVQGALDEHACVIDFIWLRDQLSVITSQLDHHVLLPTQHPQIKVSTADGHCEVQFDERRWVFPESEVVLLPVDNTTAERIAEWIGDQLMEALKTLETSALTRLRIGVDENEGQWAWCVWQW